MTQTLLFKLSSLAFLLFLSLNLNAQNIEQTAKNPVSESTVVYTFKLKDATINNSAKDDVEQVNHQEKKEIAFFIENFLKINGVSRATFDSATQTFTVIASPTAKLNLTYTKNTDHE
ncbi:MAG: hypothetical protein H0X62_16245 [Bacteroidetes bacterium]|nr:hypothetical protein [Bacteroidota bacterium]